MKWRSREGRKIDERGAASGSSKSKPFEESFRSPLSVFAPCLLLDLEVLRLSQPHFLRLSPINKRESS